MTDAAVNADPRATAAPSVTFAFVKFVVRPRLVLQEGARPELARTVLDKAKRSCLITNSLKAECELEPEIAG